MSLHNAMVAPWRSSRALRLLATLVVLSILASGCNSTERVDSERQARTAGFFEGGDQYGRWLQRRTALTTNLMITCMATQGFEWQPNQPQVGSEEPTPVDEKIGYGFVQGLIANENTAAPPVIQPSETFVSEQEEETRKTIETQCEQQTRSAVDEEVGAATIDAAFSAAAEATARWLTQPEVIASRKAWSLCMAKQGFELADESGIHQVMLDAYLNRSGSAALEVEARVFEANANCPEALKLDALEVVELMIEAGDGDTITQLDTLVVQETD